MNHLQFFIASLFTPKKLANTRMLSIGKVIQYAFLLITVLTIFSFLQFLFDLDSDTFNAAGLEEYVADIKWIIYPIGLLFIFILTAVLTFARISIYAAVGLLFVRMVGRRGEYRQIWRTATYAITWAILLSIIAELFHLPGTLWTMIGIIITVLFLWIAIQYYPKQRK